SEASGRSEIQLGHIVALGETIDAPPPASFPTGEDPVRMLLYTSGSTGSPKAAQLTESAMRTYWRKAVSDFRGNPATTPPVPRANIGLAFMPMNHVRGQLNVLEALAQGGLLNFTLRRDLSTLFEDIRLARPTVIILV
ncbi:AMP-binding protein, partial [Oceanospirillum multiglobuliferum]